MNGEIGVRSIQEGQQWHQFGLASPGGDDPGTIPRDMRAENGYGVVGRREGGPASSYWDLLRAHLSDPLTWVPEHALFAWLISRTFSANEQYFSLTTNQPIVPSAMTYQPSEQGKHAPFSFLIHALV